MSGHSILAPSGASTWAKCVGAPYMQKGREEPDKEYSESGTCTHWLGQYGLEHPNESIQQFLGQTMTFGTNPPFDFVIENDRLDHAQSYIDGVNREPGQLFVEQLLKTSPVFGVPDQSGHADAVKLDPDNSILHNGELLKGVLSVHDLKDGFGKVMAQDNLQGLSYGAAALFKYDLAAEINAIRFVIHQPRIQHYDVATYTRQEIEHFTVAIRPVAKMAYDLYHGIVPFDARQHLNAGEDQCHWCKARGACPARARRMIDAFQPIVNRPEIDNEVLGQLYAQLDEVEAACADFRAEAKRRADEGRPLPGTKLVWGRAGNRKFSNPKKVEQALSLILTDEQMYEPRTLVSPTTIENALKAQKRLDVYKKTVSKFVIRTPANTTLVPESDPRPAVAVAAFVPV